MFGDDLARLRTGHGPANMAVVRHMAVNLLHQAKPTLSLLALSPDQAGPDTVRLRSFVRREGRSRRQAQAAA